MTSDGPRVRYVAEHGVGWITLTRPHVLNAVDTQLAQELDAAVERAVRDPEARVLVVSGEGRAFSSGMDRTALSAGETGEPFFRHWIRALNELEETGKLVIAAIRGHCLGGGLQLALACDVRLATSDAVLGLGATRHALIPDGAVFRLARVVGLGRAKELALLNDSISPETALAMGLVNWVVPPDEFDSALRRVIAKCLEAAPTATRHTKRLLQASFHADPRTLIEDVVASQMECLRSWEMTEANRAWDAKREARYDPPPDSRGKESRDR